MMTPEFDNERSPAAIAAVIVDDDAFARRRIRKLLQATTDFRIVGQYDGGLTAVEAIPQLRPAVLFLDLEMPGISGFELLSRLRRGTVAQPHIVIVTAFENHAVRAFEEAAVDYLVKPFDNERFARTLDRVRQRLREREGIAELSRASFPPRLAVKRNGRIHIIRIDDVDWIQGAANYVVLHTAGGEHVVRGTLSAFEEGLSPHQFVRIHRSTIVNVDRIVELLPLPGGHATLIVRDGTALRLHAGYRDRLRSHITVL